MRKILGILFFLFTFIFIGNSQFTVKFSSALVNQNDTANINVTVDNLTNLFGAQFSINWDSLKFRFGAISNINPTLKDDFTFATPEVGNNIKQGTMSFLWGSSEPKSLPNGTILFTVRLKAVGAECDSTEIKTSNIPTTSEYYDQNFNVFPLTSVVKGIAKINGVGCVIDPPPPPDSVLTIKAATLTAANGTVICVPITVTNFEDIEGAQSKIKWDPTVLQFIEIKNFSLPSPILNTSGSAIGEVVFLWTPPGSTGPVTIPDGGLLLEICFTVIGAEGAMTTIDIVESDPTPFETEFTDSNGDPIEFVIIDGKVTVGTPPPPPDTLKVTIADVTVNKNNNVDVSFKVDNFIDIKGMQFAVTWDSLVAEFVERNSDAITGINAALTNRGRYNINWIAGSDIPVTLPDGSTLFNIKYKAIGNCGASTIIDIKNLTNFEVLFIGKETAAVPYIIDAGSLTINLLPCPGDTMMPQCTITAVNNLKCNGSNDGSILATVTDADDCQCIWKKDGVQFGNPLPTSNCNLINIPPGNYTLDVVCGGIVKTTCTATVSEPAAIIIGGSVTNVGCGQKGSITLSITNAINPVSYLWDNPTGATTKDIAGLDPGTYTVTVTDFNNCTSSKSFVVTTVSIEALNVTSTKVDVKCFGDSSGSINLTITDGCPAYTILWSGLGGTFTSTNEDITGLIAGTYNVTVTDGSNPASSATLSVVINQPATQLNLTGTASPSSGNDGSVQITVTGGTGTLTYNWSGLGGTYVNTMEDISGLAAGLYNVTVTDENGCTKTQSFEVKIVSQGSDLIDTVSIPTENIFAGYGVSCVNNCDGIIAGVVNNAGTAPYTVTLTGISTQTKTLATGGNFQFPGLCTGSYLVRVTDSAGKSETRTLVIIQPSIIRIERDIECSEGILSNGSIDLTVSGGAGDYNFAWSDGSITEDIRNLEIGNYSVVVSDVNGCQQLLNNISVNDCTGGGSGCYTATPIITPNNDGANDYFIISCALDIDNELYIYDRWGKLVFSQRNYQNTWNGIDFDESDLKENGFMWVFNLTNSDGSKESFKGTVTLLRD